MNDKLKKLCACGALAITIYGVSSICKNCLATPYSDLPVQDYSTATSVSVRSVAVSGISDTATTTTEPPYIYIG